MKFFTRKNKDIKNLFETVKIMSLQIDILNDDIVELKKDIKTPLAVLNKKIKENKLDLYKILAKIMFLENNLKIINNDNIEIKNFMTLVRKKLSKEERVYGDVVAKIDRLDEFEKEEFENLHKKVENQEFAIGKCEKQIQTIKNVIRLN